MVAIWKSAGPNKRPTQVRRALHTEHCRDKDGKRYKVIVWREWPGLSLTSYTLEDGTPVHYEDECYFALPSGKMLTRCEDE
ncbi:conserved hypothetical protein [Hyphomicrobiales bacterium]|nr:conserved hypothetical protein [Hyphomicrobiales bacterium]CAH1702296.1 conserved hypothetical protein [Hyphomicrobiales bacterium]CAI0346497.1 conserved hypothetical protein [Hyphomicrobiales bacterium]